MPRTPDVLTSVDDLVQAVLAYKSKYQDPLMDGTFLATLKAKSHQQLLCTCFHEPNKTLPMIQALVALGNAYADQEARYKKLTVSDAIRMLSRLREAAMDKPRPSSNLQQVLLDWVHEETKGAPMSEPPDDEDSE